MTGGASEALSFAAPFKCSVGYLHHAVPDDCVIHHVALLKLLDYDILSHRIILAVHHCIVEVWIKLFSFRLAALLPESR